MLILSIVCLGTKNALYAQDDGSDADNSLSLKELALRLAQNGPFKTLHTPRRVRILFRGACLADTLGTSGAVLVWEHEYYPQLYLPESAFFEPAGFDVVTSERDVYKDDRGRKVATELEIKVRLSKSSAKEGINHGSDEAFENIWGSVFCFAQDLEGPAEELRGMVKVQFAAVGECKIIKIGFERRYN